MAIDSALSKLGIGMAAVGRPAYITADRAADLGDDRSVTALRDRARSVLDAAYDGGLRYVDTARSHGRAEEFLAYWLQRRQPTGLTIASKWGYEYVGEWRTDAQVHEVKDHSIAAFNRQRGRVDPAPRWPARHLPSPLGHG